MKKLSLDDIHHRLLNIASNFDQICVKYGIPYYMLGGTMLGAIRHKGFIPWDDDMDFGVPRKYYNKLIKILENELPYPYRCCTYKNNPAIQYPFIKIDDYSTVIVDPRVDLPIKEQIGVNIDVFPLDDCNVDDKKLSRISFWKNMTVKVYVESTDKSCLKRFLKKILRSICPYSHRELLEKQERLIKELKQGQYLSNIYGRWGRKEFVDKSWYGDENRYSFENIELMGFEEYDKYLTQMYGNYMELPSETSRRGHVDNAYLRDL